MIKNWDEEIRKQKLELETEITEKEIGRKTENKMTDNFNRSWELLKTCVDFREEHELTWK